MDVNKFLESGLLESYILQQCTPEEVRLVENMIKNHPEVFREKIAIENALEKYARSQSLQPPQWMKGRIMQRITEQTPIAPSTTISDSGKYSLPAIAAMLILSSLFIVLYFLQKDQNQKSQIQMAELHQEIEDCNEQASQMSLYQRQVAFLNQTSTNRVELRALDASLTDVYALVYDNQETGETLLGLTNLPALEVDRDYQLWVIVAGNDNPIPMNVFSYNTFAEDPDFVEFHENAMAFAVSIEPKGGSPDGTPTLVYMLGSV